eukprot:TRINITY_DN1256_c0_g3_i1.p1 TRINITY_DN1256_c0_g3~~TRINITY_DN1256_c0_g3_i1.p1  ORF type:complete len:351 (+),score=92.78 TRINITY_DN1256_c0_g3_i1:1832-2884(+)
MLLYSAVPGVTNRRGVMDKMSFLAVAWTGAVVLVNILSVVGIVILNKKIFTQYEFEFPNALMAIHFLVVAVGVVMWQLVSGFDLGDKETRPSMSMLATNALLHVVSVMFVNLSLLYNSVGSYQILKLATIPVLCVLEYFLRNIRYSLPIVSSLGVLLAGIGLTTSNDITFNWSGLAYGSVATFATAGYQITVKDLTKGLDSKQSLYFTAPLAAVIFVLLIPLSDNVGRLYQYQWTYERSAVILTSGLLALVIQFTVFAIIGKTSPVTYQVIGHTKTLCVLLSGFLLFNTPVNTKNLSGMITAMFGVIWYTQLKLSESDDTSKNAASSPRHQYHDSPDPEEEQMSSLNVRV